MNERHCNFLLSMKNIRQWIFFAFFTLIFSLSLTNIRSVALSLSVSCFLDDSLSLLHCYVRVSNTQWIKRYKDISHALCKMWYLSKVLVHHERVSKSEESWEENECNREYRLPLSLMLLLLLMQWLHYISMNVCVNLVPHTRLRGGFLNEWIFVRM